VSQLVKSGTAILTADDVFRRVCKGTTVITCGEQVRLNERVRG